MTRKRFRQACGIIAALGFLLVLGTAGASDCDLIPMSQILRQGCIGLGMLAGRAMAGRVSLMTVKKDPKRQLLGKIAKARGKQFESRIDDSFAYYAQKGFAIIEKTPEPMHPTKNLGNGKFIAYYEKQAQPDYKGTIKGGRTVMFEAKFTAADRMEQSRVLQSQQDYMDRHQALGARCFVIAGFSSGMVYCVPWDIWRTMKDHFGRKYVTEADLEKYQVQTAWRHAASAQLN